MALADRSGVRQERVAFDICDGFARASGRPAVVFTDAGPAAANLMGGLVNSWGDSVPVLFLAGHNDRTENVDRQTTPTPGPTAIYTPQSGELVAPDGTRFTVSESTDIGGEGWKQMLTPAG